MPSIGKIEKIGAPTLSDTRLDCGFNDGAEVGVNYDPILAKPIVWGVDRGTSPKRTIQSLDEVLFLGVKTNRDYLKRILSHTAYIEGKTHTHFIPQYEADLKPKSFTEDNIADLIAAFSLQGISRHTSSGVRVERSTPWTTLTGFRN